MYWHVRGTHPSACIAFVDDVSEATEIFLEGRAVPIVKDWRFGAVPAGEGGSPIRIEEFVIGVGDPRAKRMLVGKALDSGLRPAPTVIHPRALVQADDCRIGKGGIIAPGCVLTTNVTVGDYVLLNLNCTLGHDAVLGEYVTCNPGCNISGNVMIGEGAALGTGTVVRQGIDIARGVVTGAQACIVKDIVEPGITVAGVPARPLAGSQRRPW